MRPRLDRIAFAGATTFAALAGLAALGNGSGDTPVVTQTQPKAAATTEPVAFTTPHPTAVFTAKATAGSDVPASTATSPLTPPEDGDAATPTPTAGTVPLSAPVPPSAAAQPTAIPVAAEAPPAAAPTATQVSVVGAPTPTPEPAWEPQPVIEDPPAEIVAPTPTQVSAETTECHPAYVECLPITGDLDCGDIRTQVQVRDVYDDPYILDADNDGIGCESW